MTQKNLLSYGKKKNDVSSQATRKRETSHLFCIKVSTSLDHPQIQVCQIRGLLVTPGPQR